MNQDKLNNKFINACRLGDLELTKKYHKMGADIHVYGDWALRWSAEHGHLHVIKYLIENGTDIHTCGDYALCWSAYYGHLHVIKYLIENGADIHADDDFALCRSAGNGHLHVVNYLRSIDNGNKWKCHECIIKTTCSNLCEDYKKGEYFESM